MKKEWLKPDAGQMQGCSKKTAQFMNLKFKALLAGAIWYLHRKVVYLENKDWLMKDTNETIIWKRAFEKALKKTKWNPFYKTYAHWSFQIFIFFLKSDNAYKCLFIDFIKNIEREKNVEIKLRKQMERQKRIRVRVIHNQPETNHKII